LGVQSQQKVVYMENTTIFALFIAYILHKITIELYFKINEMFFIS